MRTQTVIQRWRIWAILAALVAFTAYVGYRLFDVQVLENQVMATRIEDRITITNKILPNRGVIRDSKGYLLAGNSMANDLYIDKTYLSDTDLRTVTDLVAPVIGRSPDDLYQQVSTVTATNQLVYRRLDTDAATRIEQLQARPLLRTSVQLLPEPRREYPNGSFAAQLLGFADYDNQGQYGVEGFYDQQLAGQPGEVTAERDSAGRVLPMGDPQTKPAVDGDDLTLTIDSAVQFLAERELARTMHDTGAADGFILIMDPATGAIIADASLPTYDPNDFTNVTDWNVFKNPIVQGQYEPGSTFKIVTYSGSIDAGAITPDTTFYCKGTIYVYGWPISNSDVTAHGVESMWDGFGRSCNIAADFAATQLGEDLFYKYVRAYGFGSPTGVDIAGEIPGTVHWLGNDDYSSIDLYTNAFGQGISVTPIQMITAVSAIANGGKLMKPYVVQSISHNGQVVHENQPTVVRQVVTPATAATLRDMLVYDVEHGIGGMAKVPGYKIAAKTGTAQVPGTAGYNGVGTLASVVGIVPAHDPRLVIYIKLQAPTNSPWGATTASPALARLSAELFQYYKIPPTEPVTPTPAP